MFEKGYYLCKKDESSQDINEFLNAVFSNNKKYSYRDKYNRWLADDRYFFIPGRIYYSEGGQTINDNNCMPVVFSKDSTSGFGYKFEKVEVDMTEVESLIANLNKKSRFLTNIYPFCVINEKVMYICDITNAKVKSTAIDINPKSALYSAQKLFREKINKTTKIYRAFMEI